MPDEGQDKEFTVKDRRRFTTEGQLRTDTPEEKEEKARGNLFPEGERKLEENQVQEGKKEESPPAAKVESPQPKASETDEAKQEKEKHESWKDRLFRRKKKEEEPKAQPQELPEIDFATFLFSLQTAVILQMGLVPDPQTGKREVNLPSAKQTIDIIGMLKEKTKGNLTKEEETLIDKILFDLRMRYVDATRQ